MNRDNWVSAKTVKRKNFKIKKDQVEKSSSTCKGPAWIPGWSVRPPTEIETSKGRFRSNVDMSYFGPSESELLLVIQVETHNPDAKERGLTEDTYLGATIYKLAWKPMC